jgi:hypothetical protein
VLDDQWTVVGLEIEEFKGQVIKAKGISSLGDTENTKRAIKIQSC